MAVHQIPILFPGACQEGTASLPRAVPVVVLAQVWFLPPVTSLGTLQPSVFNCWTITSKRLNCKKSKSVRFHPIPSYCLIGAAFCFLSRTQMRAEYSADSGGCWGLCSPCSREQAVVQHLYSYLGAQGLQKRMEMVGTFFSPWLLRSNISTGSGDCAKHKRCH